MRRVYTKCARCAVRRLALPANASTISRAPLEARRHHASPAETRRLRPDAVEERRRPHDARSPSHPAGAPLAAFDWRVSVADVAADGPFSRFPGVDRVLVLIAGAGMRLGTRCPGRRIARRVRAVRVQRRRRDVVHARRRSGARLQPDGAPGPCAGQRRRRARRRRAHRARALARLPRPQGRSNVSSPAIRRFRLRSTIPSCSRTSDDAAAGALAINPVSAGAVALVAVIEPVS